MTQIFVASTFFGAMTVSAALDAGLFGPPDRRRMLLVSNNAAIPELATPLDGVPGFGPLAARFGEIRSWNAEIAPLHPSGWEPRPDELPLFERLFRDRWGLGDEPLELVVESVSTPPSRSLAAIFHDAEVTVYSEGLMSYGPTRNALPHGIGTQIVRQLHLDLVPGLRPQLLAEHGVAAELIPDGAFLAVLEAVRKEAEPLIAEHGTGLDGAALLVGQYLAALDILTHDEEERLHLELLRGAVARGHETVVFKPHPAAPARVTRRLSAEAAELGARLVVATTPVPAEAWCAAARPGLVAGCFSTALITARRFFDVPVATAGTGMLLDRLAPYENSNRVPVTIIDATVPHLFEHGSGDGPPAVDLERLVAAVSYCMRPAARPDLRDAAIAYLQDGPPEEIGRYFKRRRLTALGLPGGTAQPKLVTAVLPRASRRRRLAASAARKARRAR